MGSRENLQATGSGEPGGMKGNPEVSTTLTGKNSKINVHASSIWGNHLWPTIVQSNHIALAIHHRIRIISPTHAQGANRVMH